ncbi:HPr family phosphocarrier protein [Candidatus Sumerlaeota bacterium]|nr:HPr family phosphocarrier protein [Candidatus Sumerlaeota bacterium]
MKSACADVEIKNTLGIHLRPASQIVQLCNQYPGCEVELSKEGQTVNGKSIMNVIMLAAEQGSMLKIEVRGDQCEDLLARLIQLIETKFGEED